MKIPLFTRLFSQFLPSNEAKNASRMPLGCLSNTSRTPPKCPLSRSTSSRTASFYGRRSLSCRYQHVRLQGLKRKCFPHAQSAETIRNRERFDRKMGKNIVHKDVRFVPAPCSPAILHPCVPVPLRPYTLRFHFSTSPFLAFRSRQNAKWQEQAGTRCLPTPVTFLCFFIFFYYAWRYQS